MKKKLALTICLAAAMPCLLCAEDNTAQNSGENTVNAASSENAAVNEAQNPNTNAPEAPAKEQLDQTAEVESEPQSENVSDIEENTEINEVKDLEQKKSAQEDEAWMTLFPFNPAGTKDNSPVDSRSLSEISQDEFWFLKENLSEAKDDNTREALLLFVEGWLTAFRYSEHSDDVLLAKADLYAGLGDSRRALVTLMKHRQAYPDSVLKDVVQEKMNALINRKFKRHKAELLKLAEAQGEGRTSRLARLFSALAENFGDEFYEALVIEFRDLLTTAPVYAYRDRLLFSLAQLYHARGHYDEAAITYAEIIKVYPEASIIPITKLAMGEIYAREKRDYSEAIKIYQEIALKYEGREEAFIAYKELPRLLERQKMYEEAVNIYEKIISIYPDSPEARDAYRAEISILRYELGHYDEAIHVTMRMADKYKDNRAKNDLYSAAEIARINLKNLNEELKIYERIASDYPDVKNAPAAVLAAGQACEKYGNNEKAKDYYTRVISNWPNTSQASKAQKAITAMENKNK